MRRFLEKVIIGGAVLFAARMSFAQGAKAPLTCAPVEQELSAAQRALDQTRRELEGARSRAAQVESAQAELTQREQELSAKQSELNSCRSDAQNQCSAAGAFARGLGVGQVRSDGLDACIAPADRRAIVEQLSGLSNASAALAQFGAYSAGETDIRPGLRYSAGSRLERLVARLFAQGNGSPLLYRRLLLEALRLVAPDSAARLRAPGGVERWFASKDPLDPALVAEAHAGVTIAAATAGNAAPLTTALQLVTAYELLAQCREPNAARECQRAEQLRQMLETSGPLVVRRRLQDIWASDCSGLTETMVSAWFADLPRASVSDTEIQAIAEAVHLKLFTCFLRDHSAGPSFSLWSKGKLPRPAALSSRAFERVLELERGWKLGTPADQCARAVQAMQTWPAPSSCQLPNRDLSEIRAWSALTPSEDDRQSFEFAACDRLARALWAGESVTIPEAFPARPTAVDVIRTDEDAPPTSMHRLRTACAERAGAGDAFERAVSELSRIGRGLGESPASAPWLMDATGKRPVEAARLSSARNYQTWLKSLTNRELSCTSLELSNNRCRACRALPPGSHYDCAQLLELESDLRAKSRRSLLSALLVIGAGLLIKWALRLRRAVREQGPWLTQASEYFSSVGLEPSSDPWRLLFPSRYWRLELRLPNTPNWERWGQRAVLVRCQGKLRDRDVNSAGQMAQGLRTHLALIVHDDDVSPDLGAVRAMLDWSARGSKAVQLLPIAWSRLKWSHRALDLLELAEESSLRSNPFEVRGRIDTSSQFFDRERLVSGLLASAQAGHFMVVTGLRRFGKSSLALEVARRLPGPSGYVDLAGFHHEIRFSKDPVEAVDAILRFLCAQLLSSAHRHTDGELPLEAPNGAVDATTLTAWFRDFERCLAAASPGRTTPPILLIFDEIEQAIGAAEKLTQALDVFAILVGRLRNSLQGSTTESLHRVGILFCSALHPLLWSPLGTLAHQSLMGSFQYVSVPCLPVEASRSMMRGLGARQGIRFGDEALELLIEECQGVPLLLRRIGTAVLELYDPERARQGVLGAVEIGIEGVRAALEREAAEGSPLRVWVESEIAEPRSPGGTVLRALAAARSLPASELRKIATEAFRLQFEVTGVALELAPDEALRRAQEAGSVTLRMLGDSGLLRAHGDLTDPERYELPNGMIRRVLAS
jgi:hypothetical protein